MVLSFKKTNRFLASSSKMAFSILEEPAFSVFWAFFFFPVLRDSAPLSENLKELFSSSM